MLRSLNANYLKEIQILQLINQTFHIQENQLKIEIALYRNESDAFKLEVATLKNLTEINKIAAESYRNESEAYKNAAESWKKKYLESSRLELVAESTVLITVINQIRQSRSIDICLGQSTKIGIITSAKCCLADDLALMDNETGNRIQILTNEIWINELESICFINAVENFNFVFDRSNNTDQCSIQMYDHKSSKFKIHYLTYDEIYCEERKCNIDINIAQNEIILDGSAVVCENSVYGIIQRCKNMASV